MQSAEQTLGITVLLIIEYIMGIPGWFDRYEDHVFVQFEEPLIPVYVVIHWE